MTWPEAFAYGVIAGVTALLFMGVSGNLPDIHVHRHYHNQPKKKK